MKLILKDYISSLRESGELDVLVPDLLSTMGLYVFSRPQIGVDQQGVDVAAFGKLENDPEDKVYLISIKDKDLTREHWNSGNPQDVQPSLDQIINTYIPFKLPPQYKSFPIEIVVCCGGELMQNVVLDWNGFQVRHQDYNFLLWNGDYLSKLVHHYLLNESILNKENRKLLSKTLALLDQPEDSLKYFKCLIFKLSELEGKTQNASNKAKCIKTVNLILNIIHVWAREEDNLELPYLAGELSVLSMWELIKQNKLQHSGNTTKVGEAYTKLIQSWNSISFEYYNKFRPAFPVLHGLSRGSDSAVDHIINIFEVLGRVSSLGLIYMSLWERTGNDETAKIGNVILNDIIKLIDNNPLACNPIYDDHIIDIGITLKFFSYFEGLEEFTVPWVSRVLKNSVLGYKKYKYYPMICRNYENALYVSRGYKNDERKALTAASTLYPLLALWAAKINCSEVYKNIEHIQKKFFKHSNFQIWFPDEYTEEFLYLPNGERHGNTFPGIEINEDMLKFIEQIQNVQKSSFPSNKISCIKKGFDFLGFVASRHYRIPLILQMWINVDQESKS